MKKISILLLLMIILFAACNKKEIYYLTEEQKNAFSFNIGSYWIYRDSISGRMDSCYMAENRITIDIDPEDSRRRNEIQLKMVGFTQVPLDHSIEDTSSLWFMFSNKHKPIIEIYKEKYLYPIVSEYVTDAKYTRSTAVYPTLVVGSVSYSGVSNVFSEWRNNGAIGFQNFWFKPDIGFIKYSIKNDSSYHVWELQRYKIVK